MHYNNVRETYQYNIKKYYTQSNVCSQCLTVSNRLVSHMISQRMTVSNSLASHMVSPSLHVACCLDISHGQPESTSILQPGISHCQTESNSMLNVPHIADMEFKTGQVTNAGGFFFSMQPCVSYGHTESNHTRSLVSHMVRQSLTIPQPGVSHG